MMWKSSMLAVLATVLVAGCVVHREIPPYGGSVAPPQLAYRIDDHRYFEVVPKENLACHRADLFYVDTNRGIRTSVTNWDRIAWGKLLIDATNDQYLISPIIYIDPFECQSGDSRAMAACNSRLRYSTDAGRTWNVFSSTIVHVNKDVYLIGDTVYHAGLKARVPDLAKGDSAWSAFPADRHDQLPPLSKAPIDNEPHCDKSKSVKE